MELIQRIVAWSLLLIQIAEIGFCIYTNFLFVKIILQKDDGFGEDKEMHTVTGIMWIMMMCLRGGLAHAVFGTYGLTEEIAQKWIFSNFS